MVLRKVLHIRASSHDPPGRTLLKPENMQLAQHQASILFCAPPHRTVSFQRAACSVEPWLSGILRDCQTAIYAHHACGWVPFRHMFNTLHDLRIWNLFHCYFNCIARTPSASLCRSPQFRGIHHRVQNSTLTHRYILHPSTNTRRCKYEHSSPLPIHPTPLQKGPVHCGVQSGHDILFEASREDMGIVTSE